MGKRPQFGALTSDNLSQGGMEKMTAKNIHEYADGDWNEGIRAAAMVCTKMHISHEVDGCRDLTSQDPCSPNSLASPRPVRNDWRRHTQDVFTSRSVEYRKGFFVIRCPPCRSVPACGRNIDVLVEQYRSCTVKGCSLFMLIDAQ